MITILGILLLLIPYILVFNAKYKLKTLLAVFTFTSLAYVCIAVLTQALHIFTYEVILTLHSFIALYSLYLYRKRRASHHEIVVDFPRGHVLPTLSNVVRDNIFPIFFLVLAFCLMYSVHFNYSGYVDSSIGLQKSTYSSYSYPLYSDEWAGVSFVDYSMRTGQLPFANPLDRDVPFPNFLFITHSLVADILLLLGLSAVTSYIYFSILNALAIVVALFLILKLLKVRDSLASITAFSALLLTNSGNLPGIWFLLPYAVSLTYLLYSIICLKLDADQSHHEQSGHSLKHLPRLAVVNSALSLFIYPPMIVFILPVWLAYFGNKVNAFKKIYITVFACLALVAVFLTLFLMSGFQAGQTFAKAASYLVRNPLDVGIVYYWPWNVIPAFIIPFICIGLYSIFKHNKKIILYPIIVGLAYWIFYTFNQMVYIIEPARVVVITSIFLMISAGLGFDVAYSLIKKKTKNTIIDVGDPFSRASLKVLVLFFFVFWVLNISKLGLWHKMPLIYDIKIPDLKGDMQYQHRKLTPAPPVTRYITQDDLSLFSGFEMKRFISPSWKGLVIGVATHNYPLDSKSSTITNSILSYDTFMSAGCDKKKEYIKRYNINLIYSASTTCAGYHEIGQSSEGFHLYSVDKL